MWSQGGRPADARARSGSRDGRGLATPGVDKDEFSFYWSARRGFVSYGNANANSEQVNSVSLFIAKSEQDILSMYGPLPDKKGGKWATVGGQMGDGRRANGARQVRALDRPRRP
jgi:hypothetical protein